MIQPTKPSLADVAREAGVSTATVSRVLNGSGYVREPLRELVLSAVERLHYTPNLHARTLAGGYSRTIGVIVSNLENPFFVDVYRNLEQEAHRLGYDVLVANTDYNPEQLIASAGIMIGRRVSGIAAIVSEMTPALLKELTSSGVPIICSDISGSDGRSMRNVITVRVDYAAGMRQIVELLYGLGHRHFAFVGHHSALAPLSARQQAFTGVLHGYGDQVTHRIVSETDALEGGYRVGHALLDSSTRPTAIVCVNDFMAVGVLRALQERNVRVPGDISVTGFDNVKLAKCVTPTLTTVDIPRAEIGRQAVRLLLNQNQQDHGNPGEESIITPELVVRESTGPAQ